jgi:hypothetical protein
MKTKTALERWPWAGQWIKVTPADAYTKHGCNIRGNLLILDYSEAIERHPRHDMFNSQAPLDMLDVAREIAARDYPGATEKLGIPDLVIRLPDDLPNQPPA